MGRFYKGMDISWIPEELDRGMEIKDFDGTVMEPLELAKKYGVNAIRLRLWNEPANVPEAKGYCNLAHTIEVAKKIKEHDMSFMLDFHYSDFWADPGQQNKPLAWKELHGEELEKAVFEFTRDTLTALEREGVLPDVVQIGNEIRSGLLFPDGELPNVTGMVKLINAGIRGARAVADADRMKVMIHLDQGGRYQFIYDWFTQAIEAGMEDFDLMGLSYYPFWHGTFMDIKNSMERLIDDFKKPIIIVETAHAWRKSSNGFIDEAQEKIAGFPATPEGQKKVIDIIMNIVASLPNEMGQGVYYWEPLCIPKGEGGWMENMGVLSENGTVHEAIKAFLFTREQQCFDKIAKIYEPKKHTVLVGSKLNLPDKVQVLYYNGETKMMPVVWQTENADITKQVGNTIIKGCVEGSDMTAKIEVETLQEMIVTENLLKNADWVNGLEDWEITVSDEKVNYFLEDAVLVTESPMNFRFTISQTLQVRESGIYRLKVLYRGVDTTNVDVRMFMESSSQYQDQIIHPTDDDWSEYELDNVRCKEGWLQVGIKIVSPPIYARIKGFYLEKVS